MAGNMILRCRLTYSRTEMRCWTVSAPVTISSFWTLRCLSFKISEESIALVNRKYHDLKHQIAFLRSSTDDTERNTYLDRMEDEIRTFEAQTDSGNEVLDAILGTKILQCMNENIDFHVMADGTVLGFMDKMDVSALFGNILDNAIEAASKVKDGGERRIRLYISEKKGFVKVLAENTYAGDLLFEGGIPLTTKQFETS